MAKFPVQTKAEIGKQKVKVPKDILNSIMGESQSKAGILLQELQSISRAGIQAGQLEMTKLTYPQAVDYLVDQNFNLSLLPNLAKNFKTVQAIVKKGWTHRKDMPVINSFQVKEFQQRLKAGMLDIHKPFTPDTNMSDPFPQGLSGTAAQAFMDKGLRDGELQDDIINVNLKKTKISSLKPIQQQIYFDQSMDVIMAQGIEGRKKHLQTKSIFITSQDNFIIDGHHRFLTGMLIDPKMTVQTLVIDLPIKKLLPLAVSYSDAVGNRRNL